MPKYSYIITEGYERSKVYIDEVLRKKLESIIESMDVNGVTSVDGLPDSGEEGKIYYNTSDGKYYVYSGSAFKDVMGGVNTVTELPQTGEVGCIYYNSTDGKYYTWSAEENRFDAFVSEHDSYIPIIDIANEEEDRVPVLHTFWYDDNDNQRIVYYASSIDYKTGGSGSAFGEDALQDANGYYLEKNVFYDLGTFSAENVEEDNVVTTYGGLRLYLVDNSSGAVCEYMGRFTVDMGSASSFNFMFISSGLTDISVTIPDDTPDFEDGHTYEFNISASVLAIKDITYTEP